MAPLPNLRVTNVLWAALVFTAISAALGGAKAQGARPAADRQISFVVGYTPGGAYDALARIVAQHLPSFLRDPASVVVRNMPGAASFTAANYLFSQAPRDGSAIGMVGNALTLAQAFKQNGVNFDMGGFTWIGRLDSSVDLTISVRPDKVRTIEEAKQRELTIGGTTPQSTTNTMPLSLNRIVGTKFRIVLGYGGFSNLFLAMERGEIEGGHNDLPNLASMRPGWLADHNGVVLVQYARERHALFPDVPTSVELGPTQDARDELGLFASGGEIGYSVIAPPGLAPETAAELRRAFDAMCHDVGFLADMRARRVNIDFMAGEELQRRVRASLATRPEIVERARRDWEP